VRYCGAGYGTCTSVWLVVTDGVFPALGGISARVEVLMADGCVMQMATTACKWKHSTKRILFWKIAPNSEWGFGEVLLVWSCVGVCMRVCVCACVSACVVRMRVRQGKVSARHC